MQSEQEEKPLEAVLPLSCFRGAFSRKQYRLSRSAIAVRGAEVEKSKVQLTGENRRKPSDLMFIPLVYQLFKNSYFFLE